MIFGYDIKYNNSDSVPQSEVDDMVLCEIKSSTSVIDVIIRKGDRDTNTIIITPDISNFVTFENASNAKETRFKLYFNENLLPQERFYTVIFTDYNTGETETMLVEQKRCDYKIEVEEQDKEIKLNDGHVEQNIDVYVYGNTKTCIVNDNYFKLFYKLPEKEDEAEDVVVPTNDTDEIEADTDSEPKYAYSKFDYGIIYNLKEDKETDSYKKYKLNIKYIGKTNNYDDYYYQLTLRHRDDIDTRIDIKITPSFGFDSENSKNKVAQAMKSSISDYVSDNENCKNSSMNKFNPIGLLNQKASALSLQELTPIKYISVEKIIDNIIYIKTEIRNVNNIIERDSMIYGEKMAAWCSIETSYDFENETHIVFVKCEDNIYKNNRSSFLIIRNAEFPSACKKFIVTQDDNSKVTINLKID